MAGVGDTPTPSFSLNRSSVWVGHSRIVLVCRGDYVTRSPVSLCDYYQVDFLATVVYPLLINKLTHHHRLILGHGTPKCNSISQ